MLHLHLVMVVILFMVCLRCSLLQSVVFYEESGNPMTNTQLPTHTPVQTTPSSSTCSNQILRRNATKILMIGARLRFKGRPPEQSRCSILAKRSNLSAAGFKKVPIYQPPELSPGNVIVRPRALQSLYCTAFKCSMFAAPPPPPLI